MSLSNGFYSFFFVFFFLSRKRRIKLKCLDEIFNVFSKMSILMKLKNCIKLELLEKVSFFSHFVFRLQYDGVDFVYKKGDVFI